MKKLIATILITASSGAAVADSNDIYNLQQLIFGCKRGEVEHTKLEWINAGVEKCTAALDEARKAGKPKVESYSLAEAEAVCRDGRFYQVVLKDKDLFSQLADSFMFIKHKKADGDQDYLKSFEADTNKCDKAVEALLAANVPTTTPFQVGRGQHQTKTVADLKPKVCDAARAEAKRALDELIEETAKDREPFLKVGIKDDKLEFIVKNDGEIYLPGKRQPSSPKDYAKASTMFLWTVRDPDIFNYVVNTVYKYVFKGNKLVKESYRTYRLQDGREPPAAAFK
jgi:hypothetical protein